MEGAPWVLLSGFAGAFLVFVLGIFREWWRDERERRGLLRLLGAEIDHNEVVVSTIAERRGDRIEDWIGHPDLPSMKAETWRDVRERAAALLPADVLAAVEGYYSPLETSLTLLQFQGVVNDSADRWLRGEIKRVKREWNVAATSNPYREYLEKALTAQKAARPNQRIPCLVDGRYSDIERRKMVGAAQEPLENSKPVRKYHTS